MEFLHCDPAIAATNTPAPMHHTRCDVQAAATGIAASHAAASDLLQHAPLRLGLMHDATRLYAMMKVLPVPLTAFARTSSPPNLPAWYVL